jgi:large subunit ribosomal protein L1
MQKRSKRYKQAAAMVTAGKVYSLEEAVTLVRKFPTVKFNQTVTVSFHMGVDPKKSELMVRGTCPLPHGSGKSVRVLVFAQGNAAEAARAAGAEFVGYEDIIAKIKDGFVDFDVAIATPEAMTEVRKLGKQLGPRGLMPNPRTGTVTDDPVAAIKAVKAGRADFKLDKNGNIAAGVGKVAFEVNQLVDNASAFIDAVNRARPSAAKGRFILSCTLTATMSPGLPVDISKFVKI